jgi:hypothetical protein
MKLRKRISFATLDAYEREILLAFERPGRRRFTSKLALAKLNAKLRAAARAHKSAPLTRSDNTGHKES